MVTSKEGTEAMTNHNAMKKLGRRKAGSYGRPGTKVMKRAASKASRRAGKVR